MVSNRPSAHGVRSPPQPGIWMACAALRDAACRSKPQRPTGRSETCNKLPLGERKDGLMVLVMGAGMTGSASLMVSMTGSSFWLLPSGWGWKVWSRSAVMLHIALAHDAAGSRRRRRLGARSTRGVGACSSAPAQKPRHSRAETESPHRTELNLRAVTDNRGDMRARLAVRRLLDRIADILEG